MKTIYQNQYYYEMNKNHEASHVINSGDTIMISTIDCYSNKIINEVDFESITNINPCTGPIFINEAKPGDILKIEIIDIEVTGTIKMRARPNSGIIGEVVKSPIQKIIENKESYAIFGDYKIELEPMIGTIGVFPLDDPISTTLPGLHGGNMDCKEIKAGNTVFLPVFHNHAGLYIGDIHAFMNDGELICGGECDSITTLKVSIIKNKDLPTPSVLSKDKLMIIDSQKNIEKSLKSGLLKTHRYLTTITNITSEEVYLLMMAKADLRINQIANNIPTIRIEIPIDFFNIKID